ncbi:TPR repeat region-containing protein [Nocardia sp. NPDC055321]
MADTEHDPECPVGLTVGDDWTVRARPFAAGEFSAADERKIQDRIDHHRGLINAAHTGLVTAVGELVTGINAAVDEVRVRGNQLGDGIDAPGPTPVDPAALGRQDGDTVADGKLSRAEIARISGRLEQAGLTPEQLSALADGGEITVPQSTMDYLSGLYDRAGRDGLIQLASGLQANGSPEALQLRRELAQGLLTLSTEKVVTRGSDGQVDGRGGWDRLDPEVREFIGTRPNIADAPDANTRLVPDDYRGKLFGAPIDDRHGLFDYTRDMATFAGFINGADPAYAPGERFGVELQRQAAHQAWILDHGGYAGYGSIGINEPDWLRDTERSAQDLLGVGARNTESSYALLTGNGSEELFGKDVPGQSYEKYDPKLYSSVFQHDWKDGGKAAGSTLEWIGSTSHDVDSDGKPTVQALHAREALTRLPDFFASSEDAQDPAKLGGKPELHRSGGLDVDAFDATAKGFSRNPELARSLAHVMGSNIDSYIDGTVPNTAYLAAAGEAQLQVTDANRLLFLSSQSEQGRLTLEVARQAYESEVLTQAFSQSGKLPGDYASDSMQQLASLGARVTNAAQNALTYQDGNKIHDYNANLREIFEKKMAAAELISEVTVGSIELAPVPGGDAGGVAAEMLAERVAGGLIERFIPEPDTLGTPLYPNVTEINAQGYRNFQQEIINSAFASGKLDPALIDSDTGRPLNLNESQPDARRDALRAYLDDQGFTQTATDYNQTYGIEVLQGVGRDGTSLSVILAGREDMIDDKGRIK